MRCGPDGSRMAFQLFDLVLAASSKIGEMWDELPISIEQSFYPTPLLAQNDQVQVVAKDCILGPAGMAGSMRICSTLSFDAATMSKLKELSGQDRTPILRLQLSWTSRTLALRITGRLLPFEGQWEALFINIE